MSALQIVMLIIGVLLALLVAVVILSAWALYKVFYTEKGADYLEVYTSDGRFWEDVFPELKS